VEHKPNCIAAMHPMFSRVGFLCEDLHQNFGRRDFPHWIKNSVFWTKDHEDFLTAVDGAAPGGGGLVAGAARAG